MIHEVYESDFESLDNLGRCDACGAEAYGVEPDARGYVCEDCGAAAVYGLEELLMMGQVALVGD